MNSRRPLEGQRFNRLLVLAFVGRAVPDRNGCRALLYRVRCDCGTEKVVRGCAVANGSTVSCGCFRDAMKSEWKKTHGRTGTPEYSTWRGMIRRSHSGTADCAADYKGRGIRVCERWLKFENFLADMGPRPSPAHSIDRIDNGGHYEPGNCRWATSVQQNRNRRSNRPVTAKGRTRLVVEWAADLGITPEALAWRLDHGWPPDRAVSQPGRFA